MRRIPALAMVCAGMLTAPAARLAAQSAPSCDRSRADSAQSAYQAGRIDDAIRLGREVAGRCASSAYVLYYAYQRKRDMAAFRTIATPLAQRGDPEFSYFLASDLKDRLFIDEISAARRLDSALRYFEVAHTGRNSLATKALGEFYFVGRFQLRDLTAPRRDYQRASQYFAACRYDAVVGVECTEALAQAMLRDPLRRERGIALLDSANALEALWALHQFGLYRVTRDTGKARQIEQRMRAIPESREDRSLIAMRFFLEDLAAARAGDGRGARRLAERFGDDEVTGAPDDGPTFVELSLAAVRLGDAWAASNLADSYAEGRLSRQDLVTAYSFYSIALDRGDPELQERSRGRLDGLTRRMSVDEVREAQRLTRQFLTGTAPPA